MLNLQQLLSHMEEQSPITSGEIGMTNDRDFRVDLLNRGQDQFASRVKISIRQDILFQTEVGKGEYDLRAIAPTFIDINPDGGVTYDGDRLDPTTVAELDRESSNWRRAGNGTPFKYYVRDHRWFGLYASPDTADKDVAVGIFSRPINMVDDFDLPFNGDEAFMEYDEAPLAYALWKTWSRINVQMRDRYKRDFDELVALCRGEINRQRDEQPRLTPMVYNVMRLRRGR